MTVFLFTPTGAQEWQPPVDIYRTKDGWLLKFDLAGVRMEDVHVRVGQQTVMVSGVRRDWMLEEAGCRHYSMEITYSRFERTIELPGDLNAARFRLDYRDGILFVRISEREESGNE